MADMRLNLGCGLQVVDGWINFDSDPRDDERVMRGSVLDGLPFQTESITEVYTGHFLHLFTYWEVRQILLEIRRVLHPTGELRIAEFDPLKAFQAYLQDEPDFFPFENELEPTPQGKLCRMLTWHSTRRTLWTAESIWPYLEAAGFPAVWKSEYGRHPMDQRPNESFFMSAA